MVGHVGKKRRNEHKTQRPKKKFRRAAHQKEYNSDTESEQGDNQMERDFAAVDLLDSDDDVHNAKVDDGADEAEGDSSSEEETKQHKARRSALKSGKKPAPKKGVESDDEEEEEEEEQDDNEDDAEDDDEEGEEGEGGAETSEKRTKSKRNDPTAFATSLSKILSTKLSTSKRSDPVLSRSAAAHEASKAAVDNALETKAKRRLKEQKRVAMEKGRVRDVLLPASAQEGVSVGGGETGSGYGSAEGEMTTSEILETERKLRKIAQRGVVKLFNAVRAAQVKAAEADKATRKEGVIGVKNREEKVNELSKKGFLELIASGGGGLKKGPLEEA
ncbi:Ribosomal RNA-processing protein 15 [Escovopsis weberi]|uniref:Ribosomal RNA-processing protein 15 n=1 Tax=Escovopsis weberi TaxID=150374 RepID=A0A0N0RTA6_ESCWE|nr:Ribosomal RNA-processing protein 15 [Escovopsis weberi]